MNGKVIKLNDYKFNFGQETIFLNVFAVFKNIKNGNKYIIYSYDNKKLYSGSTFIKNNEIVIDTDIRNGCELILLTKLSAFG